MKALTLHQPWASLVAIGVKTIETRSWSTDYRGPLAIHAAARSFGINSDTAEVVRSFGLPTWRRLGDEVQRGRHVDPEMGDNYPRGVIVATCTLVDVVPVLANADERYDGRFLRIEPHTDGTELWIYNYGAGGCRDATEQEPYGDFRPGRFAWLLNDVHRLARPVAARGRQRLWNWERPS